MRFAGGGGLQLPLAGQGVPAAAGGVRSGPDRVPGQSVRELRAGGDRQAGGNPAASGEHVSGRQGHGRLHTRDRESRGKTAPERRPPAGGGGAFKREKGLWRKAK